MSGWAKRRFWTEVRVTESDAGFGVLLDGRQLRTPARAALAVPTLALADRIAEEWRAQDGVIDPGTMPATRAANVAIDKVRDQRTEVAELIASYGDSDLICYRAVAPQELVEREAEAWDPLLHWADRHLGARLKVHQGVMYAPQPIAALQALTHPVHAMSAFELTAFHDLVSISGSLVIGLAVIDAHAPAETLWQCSRVDEDWQESQWGYDPEAHALAESRRRAFLDAAAFYNALIVPPRVA